MSISNKDEFRIRLDELMDCHLHREDLDNVFLAKSLYLSEAQFYRAVKQIYSASPNRVIRKKRLRRAQEYLNTSSNLTVREAAFQVGFTHVGYFIRRYKEMFGYNPGERQRSRLC